MLIISSNQTKYFMIPLFQVVKLNKKTVLLMEVNIEMYANKLGAGIAQSV
jgi:hypothetical protein